MMAPWRVAARLARREVRRHWVRSALVVLIVALPVAGAQAGALLYRSAEGPEVIDSRGSRLVPEPQLAGAHQSTGFDPRLGRPPAIAGAERVETGFSIFDWTTGPGGDTDDLTTVNVVGFVPDASEVDLEDGRLPETRREVAITQELADEAGLGIGDQLEVIASGVELEVVGLAGVETDMAPTAWAGPVVDGDDWVPDALARIRDSGNPWVSADMFDLYWLPEGTRMDAYATGYQGEHADDRMVTAEGLVIGASAAAIAVGFVATVCSAAFAIGARRQLRSLGTLAATGAGPADLARAVLLQGTVLGLAGGLAATTLVYIGRAVIVARLSPTSTWRIAWAPDLILGIVGLGVLAGTLAALVPALTASRIPTLSALAGRRPTRRRRLRSPSAGIALVGVGLALLSWASGASPDEDGRAAVAALAVLLTMAGGVALSPAVVAGLGRLAGRSGRTVRLAGRTIARDGMRSAAIVATTAVAVAIPVVVLVWSARDTGGGRISDQERADQELIGAAEEAVATVDVGDGGDVMSAEPVAEQVRAALGPDALLTRESYTTEDVVRAVDPDALDDAGGDALVVDALRAGDRVALSRAYDGMGYGPQEAPPADDGRETVLVDPEDLSPLTLTIVARSSGGLVPFDALPEPAGEGSWTVFRDGPLTEAEDEEVTALGQDEAAVPTYAELRDLAGSSTAADGVGVYTDRFEPDADVPWDLIVFGASVVLSLLVIGVASALGAADGRPDEQVVAAVGAPPAVVRRRRVLEATFTAAGATVLGGGLAAVSTLVTIHSPFFTPEGVLPVFRFPLLEVAGVTLGTVAVVGGATWLALAGAARVRGRRDLFLVDA